jgi:hypothetical protein
MKENVMKKTPEKSRKEMRDEYEFDYSKAARGKYAQEFTDKGTNIVVLEPDVARSFRDSDAVNKALRSLLEVTRRTRRLTSRSPGRTVPRAESKS